MVEDAAVAITVGVVPEIVIRTTLTAAADLTEMVVAAADALSYLTPFLSLAVLLQDFLPSTAAARMMSMLAAAIAIKPRKLILSYELQIQAVLVRLHNRDAILTNDGNMSLLIFSKNYMKLLIKTRFISTYTLGKSRAIISKLVTLKYLIIFYYFNKYKLGFYTSSHSHNLEMLTKCFLYVVISTLLQVSKVKVPNNICYI